MSKIVNWKDKVIYQIFPRSFKDSNNDGNGDLQGLTSQLDYLAFLGIDAIWLCPLYDTNFADAGYDVKNYKSIWKQFGTLSDFKKMVKKAKKLKIEIIMDIVLNHVSSEHEWFKKACLSVKNKEHDYFIWRKELSTDEKKAMSIFGGSAWEFEPNVQKYYFHLFAKEQVDLNWEHPKMIDAMVDIINFWYKLGVRGFRMDAIKHISKKFPEGNKNSFSWGPTVVKQLQKFNSLAFKDKKDVFVLGESSGITCDEMIKYGTGKNKVASNYFNFSWWWIGWGKETGRNGYDSNWDYKNFALQMQKFQHSKEITSSLMTNFLSNHDTSRAVSRWGNEGLFWKESAKTLALMLFSLKGIPCVYYGEEIGMLNPVFANRSEFRDVDALNAYKFLVDQKKYYSEDEMTKYHNINGRDNCRTPMHWNNHVNAGFNEGHQPWIKISEHYSKINVAKQIDDPNSILLFYKKIISLRKSKKYKPILVDGLSSFEILSSGAFQITRTSSEKKKIVVFLNLTKKSLEVPLDDKMHIILKSWSDEKTFSGQLRPYESIMFEVF